MMAEAQTDPEVDIDILLMMAEAQTDPEVDTDSIIREVMEDFEIDPSDIPEERPFELRWFLNKLRHRRRWSRRYYKGHTSGEFRCSDTDCANTWKSPHSWCIIDLKEQTILMKFKQKCIKVKERHVKENPGYEGEYPVYTNETSVRKMVEWAVKRHLNKPAEASDSHTPTAKHPCHLCEMCKLLKRPCHRPQAKKEPPDTEQ